MEKKRDFRILLTKKLISDAYLRLREKKPLHRVTVCELCAEAGVGRGTFYAHYDDIYALHEEIENEFFGAFGEKIRSAISRDDASPRRVCREIFPLLEENRALCALVLDRDNARGLQKFTRLGEELFLEKFAPSPARQEKAILCYRFVSAGCVACLQDRLFDRRIPLTHFSDDISEFIRVLTEFFE